MRERGERSDCGLEGRGWFGERSAGRPAELRHRALHEAGRRSMAAAETPRGRRRKGGRGW